MDSSLPTIPEGLDLIPRNDGAIIRRVWLSWKIAFLAVFAVFWDSFLYFWYAHALGKPNVPLMTLLFPLMHVAVGIGLTYYVLASLVNKTDIEISPSGVKIATGPAPWIGNKEVSAGEITAVLVRERSSNRNRRSYSVMYADRARKERKLVTWLPELDQAEFIAEVVRRTLAL